MKKIMSVVISSLIMLFFCTFSFIIIFFERNSVKSLYLKDDNIVIKLDNSIQTYCYVGNDYKNAVWTKAKDSKCTLPFVENNKFIFLKNKYESVVKIKNVYNLNTIKEFNVNNKIYLAVDGKEKIDYTLKLVANIKKKVLFKSENTDIASVDELGIVTGNKVGQTKIILSVDNTNLIVDVIVTDKIVSPGEEFDYKKKYIKCDEYTKEENDLIDEILFSRIKKVGKSTRAAVVEAARFLTLEFPKKISYFGENGRLTNPEHTRIDGEGRYYKEGMYLNSSRYESITKSMYGPGTWGCRMYSSPNSKSMANGLDCSGFVSWAFINAGFDVGDIGAGITPTKDFTDLGNKIKINVSLDNNKIRVGDLLSGYDSHGGHIAIVTGITNDSYFIAESLGKEGVVNKKYDLKKLGNTFYWHVDMSNFYKEDGKVTNYWINKKL